MKLNISYPVTGLQKVIEVEDEKKLRAFYDKRISHEVEGEVLGDEFKGYVFRISGGNDKQGFAMKQGVLSAQRVRVLVSAGHSCYRPRRRGERKRKSVRGCIVSSELSILNLVVVKKGEQEVAGLTDSIKPRRHGPKRASRIRKLFNLDKKDDVRRVVIRRQIVKDGKKPYTKAPKIQRLITPRRLQHKRELRADKRKRFEKSREEAKVYNDLISKRLKEERDAKKERVAKRRSQSRRESNKDEATKKAAETTKTATTTTTTAAPAKDAKKKDAKKAAPATETKKATEAPKKDAKKDAKKAAPATESKKATATTTTTAAPAKDAKKDAKKAAPATETKKATEAPKKAAEQPKKAAPATETKKAEAPKKTEQPKQQQQQQQKKGGKKQ